MYPASNTNADIFVSNGVMNPSIFEYKLNGPASPPTGITNVINVVIIYIGEVVVVVVDIAQSPSGEVYGGKLSLIILITHIVCGEGSPGSISIK